MASMYHTQYQPMALLSNPSSTPTVAALRPDAIRLTIRQQPKEALITTEGKEKARKPIDPPSIVQLNIDASVDPVQQFLQSPYLFLSVSLRKADKAEPHDAAIEKSLAGTLVSSLHRLKDISNKDGGFFVFGDISVKVAGKFRLHFSLYEFQSAASEVLYLGSIDSEPFSVVLAKDFKGMEESTYLSRAFSDQGVRLRIRKEARNLINKRGYSYDDEQQETPIQPNLPSEYSGSYDANSSPNKRFKREAVVDRKDSFPESATAMPQYSQLYTPTPAYSASYSTPRQAHLATTPTADYSHIGMQAQYASMSGQMSNAYSNRTSYYKNAGNHVYSSPSIHNSSIHDGTNGTPQYTVPSQPTFPNLFPNSYPQSSAATAPVDLLGYTGDAFKTTDQRFQQ